MSAKKFAPLLPLSAGILWGLTGIFVRRLNAMGINNMYLTFFRSSFSALGLIIFLFVTDRRSLKLQKRDIWCFFGTGILSVFTFSVCYFYTLMHSSIPVAVILSYTAPFFVVILSAILFGERITPLKVAALIMATCGCALLCGTDKNTPVTPVIITVGLLSGLAYALYSIFARFVVDKYPPLVITAYTFLFTAVASAFSISFKELAAACAAHPESIPTAAAFSLVSTLMPYVLLTIGLKYVEPGRAAILTTTEVMTASLCGILIFGEKITAAGICGMLLILTAVVIINIRSAAKKL